jgi:hypothetical protein
LDASLLQVLFAPAGRVEVAQGFVNVCIALNEEEVFRQFLEQRPNPCEGRMKIPFSQIELARRDARATEQGLIQNYAFLSPEILTIPFDKDMGMA